ncbi:MAG: apolipoprotein N-acyltransferase [Spirochaetes bacterium]|nr:apolipoprotein N-acyltransferase [Spirochaetota bacterium]
MDIRFLYQNKFFKIIQTNDKLRYCLFVVGSAILSNLAYPEINLFFIHFISLIPLFYVIYKTDKLSDAFLYGALYGFTFHLILIFWLKIFHPLSLPGLLLGFSIYFGLNLFLIKWLIHHFPKFRILIIPSVWVLIEYIRSIGFLGFPWGLTAHSQWNFIPFIQISEIFGMWIISFLIVLFNVLFLEFYLTRNKKFIFHFLVLLFIPLLFGILRIHQIRSRMENMDRIKIGLIQGNVDPNLYFSEIKYDVLSMFTVLSEKCALENVDLIVWTETTILDYLNYYIKYRDRLVGIRHLADRLSYAENAVRIAQDVETPVFTGTLDFERIQKNGKTIVNDYNSAVLISKKGQIVDIYRKNHLVPFGEWFPYGQYFPFIKRILEKTWAGNFTPSNKKTVFNLQKNNRNYPFSCLICYEGVFSDLTRFFILKGARFLLNITNDMWSFSRRAQFQHMIADVFRAVENRVPYIRSANSGVTGWINQYGKVMKTLPLFTRDYLIVEVPAGKIDTTFYTRWGDFFPRILLIFILSLVLLLGMQKMQAPHRERLSMKGRVRKK